MLDTWTIAASSLAAAGLLMVQVKEELANSIIRNARNRARSIFGIGRPKMEAAPCAGTQEPPVGRQGEPLPMTYSPIHCPAPPVYEKLLSFGSGSRMIPPKKARKSGLTRRDRALLAADVLQRSEDISTWPVSRVADAFGASARSTFEALSLSPAERDDVRAGRRPLFPSRSLRELCPCSACGVSPMEEQLRVVIDVLGVQGIRDALVEAEADVTDVVEEAA